MGHWLPGAVSMAFCSRTSGERQAPDIAVRTREGAGKLHLLSHRSCSQAPAQTRPWVVRRSPRDKPLLKNRETDAAERELPSSNSRTKVPSATKASSRILGTSWYTSDSCFFGGLWTGSILADGTSRGTLLQDRIAMFFLQNIESYGLL